VGFVRVAANLFAVVTPFQTASNASRAYTWRCGWGSYRSQIAVYPMRLNSLAALHTTPASQGSLPIQAKSVPDCGRRADVANSNCRDRLSCHQYITASTFLRLIRKKFLPQHLLLWRSLTIANTAERLCEPPGGTRGGKRKSRVPLLVGSTRCSAQAPCARSETSRTASLTIPLDKVIQEKRYFSPVGLAILNTSASGRGKKSLETIFKWATSISPNSNGSSP